MWTQYEPTVSPNNLNLDEIFSFLQKEQGADGAGRRQENKTLDEITDELNELNDLLTQDMVSNFKGFFYYFLRIDMTVKPLKFDNL